ncbi:MAG: M50 family metallopeptidase [Nanoarchaeota archaeon]
MVNFDLIFALIFYGLILIIFFKTRKRWEVHGILALFKTKIGISLMNKLAKKDTKPVILFGTFISIVSIIIIFIGISFSKTYLIGIGGIFLTIGLLMAMPIKILGHIGVALGFLGMAFIFFILIKSSFSLFLVEDAQPSVAPVLPGVKIPGLPTLSFWHWIISIFLLAIVHEFSHGILARAYNLNVKSSGFGFLGPILLAFVEPDEKQVAKSPQKAQLSLFAAGPFANFIFALLIVLFSLFILAPFSQSIFEYDGITISGFIPDYPAEKSGLKTPFVIKSVNGVQTLNLLEFINTTQNIKPNQKIALMTDQGAFTVITTTDPNNSSRGFIGIQGLTQKTKTKENVSEFVGTSFTWVSLLFMWLFFINVGVGLFNLLPLGPIDGGRMFYVVALKIFKNENKAKKVWMFAMYFVLFLIVINFIPWLTKLVTFITKLFT